jgi:hypothetical protein
MPNDTNRDQDVLRRVYEDQMRDYREALTPARERFGAAKTAYAAAGDELDAATAQFARVEGRIEALRDLAAKDGITLD